MPFKLNYPGYNYLGPGNPLNNGPPVNKTDEIAREHDIEYSTATSKSEIFKSDSKAIGNFTSEFFKHPSLAPAIGAVGLSLKTGIEHLTNTVFYPDYKGMNHNVRLTFQEFKQRKPFFSYKYNKERQREINRANNLRFENLSNENSRVSSPSYSPVESPGESPVNSPNLYRSSDDDMSDQDATNSINSNTAAVPGTAAGDTSTNPSNGKGAQSKGSSGMRGTVQLTTGVPISSHKSTRSYKKQYHLRLDNEPVEIKCAKDTYYSFNCIRYPYHDMPVNSLGFYLSKAEIRELMNYSRVNVKKVYCEAHNKTANLTFETASSISSIGNNNVGVYFNVLRKDINNVRSGCLPNQSALIEEVIWSDTDPTTLKEWTSDLNKHLGAEYVTRQFNNKFEYFTPQSADATVDTFFTGMNYKEAPFNINPHIINRFNSSFDEGIFDTFEYDFNCPLFSINEVSGFQNMEFRSLGKEFINMQNRSLPILETHTGGYQTVGTGNIPTPNPPTSIDSVNYVVGPYRNPNIDKYHLSAYPIINNCKKQHGIIPNRTFGIHPLFSSM